MEKKLDNARSTAIHRAHLQMRLQNLFSTLDQGALKPCFYTEKEEKFSLFLLYNNGIDPDPLFSGNVMGKVSIDKENNLILESAPLESSNDEDLFRREILFPNVGSSQFTFLGRATSKKEDEQKINANFAWKTSWAKSTRSVPSVIRLELEDKKNKGIIQFAFILPTADSLVTYTKAGK